jgi:organic hydroperoxide reductase OsmC/OhrA
MKQHKYDVSVAWTGSLGRGTDSYTSYSRDYEITASGKPPLAGSSAPDYRGDPARYNPEDLLVAGLSACHMLWYLHLCADNGIVVTEYSDEAQGVMTEDADGSGEFAEVTLRPRVKIAADADAHKALLLHEEAHGLCFLSRSVKFPVRNLPRIIKPKTAG